MYSACNGHLYRVTVCSSMHPQRVQNCELLLKLAIYQLRVPSSHRYRSLTSAFYQSPVLDSHKRFKHTNAAVRGDNHYRGRAFCLLWGFFTFHCDSKKRKKNKGVQAPFWRLAVAKALPQDHTQQLLSMWSWQHLCRDISKVPLRIDPSH